MVLSVHSNSCHLRGLCAHRNSSAVLWDEGSVYNRSRHPALIPIGWGVMEWKSASLLGTADPDLSSSRLKALGAETVCHPGASHHCPLSLSYSVDRISQTKLYICTRYKAEIRFLEGLTYLEVSKGKKQESGQLIFPLCLTSVHRPADCRC